MQKCGYCGGGRLKRVHRTFVERFSYLAIYECRDCENEEFVPRRYTFHFGEAARCPNCGTYRVTKLKGIDKIDKMVAGPLNRIEKLLGGNLYHCVFCRIQFYDRRKAAPRTVLEPIPPAGIETVVEAVPPVSSVEWKDEPPSLKPPDQPSIRVILTPPPEPVARPLITPPPQPAAETVVYAEAPLHPEPKRIVPSPPLPAPPRAAPPQYMGDPDQ